MKQIWAVTRKELSAYFGSPLALIFLGTFLVVTLLAFFWVEGFFARGIADVRPLFRWMPVLLLFLVAALTMRRACSRKAGSAELGSMLSSMLSLAHCSMYRNISTASALGALREESYRFRSNQKRYCLRTLAGSGPPF